eukprot:948_1
MECVSLINKYIKHSKAMASTFNTGLTFYYWPNFDPKQNEDKKEEEMENYFNVIDYSGFSKNELFISNAKYDNLKQEAINSCHCSLPMFNKKVAIKSRELFQTAVVKEMTRKYNNFNEQAAHHGLTKEQSISLQHLQSVIL